MAIQSPFSSSSFSYGFNYQVFLSFRGSDTRYGFTGNLYKALINKGIHTFIDDNDLRRGDEITPTLMKAIEESRIYIPVFSINYASSSFCLDELAHIIHCFKEKGRLILPVFYGVDPSHVRHQNGSYFKALADHEKKFQHNQKNMERLHKWKIALNQAANLAGYHFNLGSDMNEYEHKFIGNIVKDVSNKISRVPLHVADYPVGLESRVLKVNSLLNEARNDGICKIGIHGTGGIGKTTLARAIYNLIADQFECLCFLHNVREISVKHGLEHLQKQLLYQTIGLKKKIGHVSEGIQIIKQRLNLKKVLLILDDVDKRKQLQYLAGGLDWFGPNSRVIITTRDKHLLTSCGIERIYEVDGLNQSEAHEMYMWMTFKTNKVDSNYDDIFNRAINYASGLPLAIEVVGSYLSGKRIAEWDSTLDKYKRIPPEDIQNILKVSFDALDEEEKSVFLDIACCFKGYRLKEVEDILHVHYGHCIKNHVGVLVDKSLIKIIQHSFNSTNDDVTLHDLIEDMGKEIVRQESLKEPGERTRLWFHNDIAHVLKENTGTNNIEMICLNSPAIDDKIDWNGKAFKKMTNLKTLIIKSGNFSKGSKHFPNSLRVFEWKQYPSVCIPLSILNKKLENMRVLKFDNCEYLTNISDVSCLPDLKEFSFRECKNLTTIHNSIGLLKKLEILNAEGCDKLKSFPPLELPSLSKLELSYCKSLESFPEILGEIENLEVIDIKKTSIEEIPVSFQNLTGLSIVSIKGRGKLRLPSCIILNMPKLYGINVTGYDLLPSEQDDNMSYTLSSNTVPKTLQLIRNNLSYVPLTIFRMWFAKLTSLFLSGSNVRVLPKYLEECLFLNKLDIDDCHYLEDISAIPPNLKKLSALNCISLNSSSRSMLQSQKLHESGETEFRFPSPESEMAPKWFEHQSRGKNVSFWFRKKFPSTIIFFSIKSKMKDDEPVLPYLLSITIKMSIDDYECELPYCSNPFANTFSYDIPPNHTYLFDLQLPAMADFWGIKDESELDEAFLKNEWIHAEVKFKVNDEDEDEVKALNGIHILKEVYHMEDIRFTNPNIKRKLDEHLNTSLSQFQPLLKKQRLLDMEVLEAEVVELQVRMALLSLKKQK